MSRRKYLEASLMKKIIQRFEAMKKRRMLLTQKNIVVAANEEA